MSAQEEIIEVEENIEERDGIRVNLDTGEVLAAEFMIDTVDRAKWVAQKVLGYVAEEKELTLQYEKDIAKIKSRKAGFLNYFAPQLIEYTARVQEEAGGKGKVSVKLGQVSFLRKAAYLKVVDTTLGLDWAKDHLPDVIEHIVPEPYDKLNNKSYIESAEKSGIKLPGIEEIPAKVHATLELESVGEKVKLSDYGINTQTEAVSK